MWWLPRRKGFDVRAWRAPCKCQHGHDMHDPRTLSCKACSCKIFDSAYMCIGCDAKQAEHFTVFELESERVQAQRDVGAKFLPLADSPDLQRALFASCVPCTPSEGSGEGTSTAALSVAVSALSLEQRLERGEISAAEYQRRVLDEPLPASAGCGTQANIGFRKATNSGKAGRPPPTVTAFQVAVSGGTATMLTNAGPPIPRPGYDWSRPWEPGVSKPELPPRSRGRGTSRFPPVQRGLM